MKGLFTVHNNHRDNAAKFAETDPHLRFLHQQVYQYQPGLLDELPTTISRIYTVSGARQIGKTTLLKQWMQQLLQMWPGT